MIHDERQHQADLTEIGRVNLRPDNPDAFMLPDLATRVLGPGRTSSVPPERREEMKLAAQQRYATVSEEIHAISQLLRDLFALREGHRLRRPGGKVMIVGLRTRAA